MPLSPIKLPAGYTLDEPVQLPPGYTVDSVAGADVMDDPRNIFTGTDPKGTAIYQAPPGPPPPPIPAGLRPDITNMWGVPTVSVPLWNREGQIAPPETYPESRIDKMIAPPLEYLKGGMEQSGKGITGLAHPQGWDQMAGAASDVIRGTMTTATPFFAPSIIANPMAAIVGLGTFGAAQAGTEWAAGKVGVPPGFSRLAGDIFGIWGGAKAHQWLEGLANIPRIKEGDAIYRRLEESVEKLKDPFLDPDARNALRAQTEGLLDGLRQAEGRRLLPPLFPNPNQAARTAYDYMRHDVGVAPSAGAATGSPFVRGSQWLTGMTPAGAHMDVRGRAQTTEALRGRARELVSEMQPPEGPARSHYVDFEREVERSEPVDVDLRVDKDGSIIRGNVKVPVDIQDLKYDMQPLYDKMRFMPMTDRSASHAYSALGELLNADNHITGPAAEFGLSEFKKAARLERGGISEALAKTVIPKLQSAIDNAVDLHAGEEALAALRKGRAAAAKEAGADWLTEQFTKAQQEGGFGHEAVLWNNWNRLTNTAKRSMYTAGQIAELDKFFLGIKLLGENPNPSGTALVGALMAQAYELGHGGIVDPTFWMGQLATSGIAKFLRTDAGIKLLSDGLVIPRTTRRGKFIEGKIRALLESEPGEGPGGEGPPPGGPETPPAPGAPPAAGGEPGAPPPTGGGQPGPPPPAGGPSGRNPAKEAFYRAKERVGEFFSSEEGSSPRRAGRDPIADVSLRFLMENPLEVAVKGERGVVKTVDMARKLRETARSGGGSLSPDADPRVRLARAEAAMTDDLHYALASQPEARKWYTGTVQEMEAELIRNRPEFRDATKRSLFKYLLGVTSNGVDPEVNFDAAVRGWDLYQQHGKFMAYDPARTSEFSNSGEVGLTFRANSYKTAMAILDRLVQEKGEAGAVEWLKTKHPVAELKKYDPDTFATNYNIETGETDKSPRLGAYVLGEKVGAFGSNLNGIYTELTADKWWSRTWNRWMGTTIATDAEGRFKYDKETGEPLTQDDPRNQGERNLMREVSAKVAGKLSLTVAELQAVLWYAEQALYREHGLPASSADYSMAAKKYFSKVSRRSASAPGSGPPSALSPPPSGSSSGPPP